MCTQKSLSKNVVLVEYRTTFAPHFVHVHADNLNFESEDKDKQAEEIVKEDDELSLLSDDEDYF